MTREAEDCAHCAINRAIDTFAEAHSPCDIETLVDDLVACMCELIASQPAGQTRRAFAKKVAKLIPDRVRYFREIGRYPGGQDMRH